jgi:hypothetical protein
MFLGFDITCDKETNLLVMSLETHLDRVAEAMLAKDPEDVTPRSNVGALNWATSTVFGACVKEARNLASRCNLEEQGDLETPIALIHEIHSKRKQGIHFRKLDDGKHTFEPSTAPHAKKGLRACRTHAAAGPLVTVQSGLLACRTHAAAGPLVTSSCNVIRPL